MVRVPDQIGRQHGREEFVLRPPQGRQRADDRCVVDRGDSQGNVGASGSTG